MSAMPSRVPVKRHHVLCSPFVVTCPLLAIVLLGGCYNTMVAASQVECHMVPDGSGSDPGTRGRPLRMSLAGNWQFRTGEKGETLDNELDREVRLPASLDENFVGDRDAGGTRWLTRLHAYIGPALYQREVTLPNTWKGKHVELFLEQCHWKSEVWVDNVKAGPPQNSLTVPHRYDLSDLLSPGTHTLTIAVDNREQFANTYMSAQNLPLMGHSTSRHTQTNWNGIIGRIELRAVDQIWIKGLKVFPNVTEKAARVQVIVHNATNQVAKGSIKVQASSFNGETVHKVGPVVTPLSFPLGSNEISIELPMGEGVQLWDEFHPALYRLGVSLEAYGAGIRYVDGITDSFGMCTFTTDGTQFSVNGKKTFLRGTHDAAAFPLTGHPPMDVDSWLKVFRTCKLYGINHFRFHSWCPPNAAFEAADLTGMYLQPEGPTGGKITGPVPKNDYVCDEMMRIQNAFGNHPSFVIMSIGNELNGSVEAAAEVLRRLKANDPRQLQAAGSNPVWNRQPGGAKAPEVEDFCVTMNTGGYDGSKGGYVKGAVRGAFHLPSAGYLENKPPSTDTDYCDSIKEIMMPVLSHEVGQHAMYPNYNERSKYIGVLKPENFDGFLKKLQEAGMSDQARDFFLSSGKWSTLLYKEEIEAALRTRGFGGFRLLDIHDYPGQNTALVGILDVFYESKGLIEPHEWREFCCPVVPLVRMKKLTWTTNEVIEGNIQIANYSELGIRGAIIWDLRDQNSGILASGRLSDTDIPQGDLTTVGRLRIPLAEIPTPCQLMLETAIEGTECRNHWKVWVYPEDIDTSTPEDVVIASQWNEARQALAEGQKVLLLSSHLGKSVPGSQSTLFWSFEYFKHFGPAGTLGILCDPEHPALAEFPTEFHQDWQWADILKRSRALVLDFTPTGFRPIVQVVDNKFRNHKLGNVFEARVGRGSLLVCSMDVSTALEERPVARQMRHSLLAYMSSGRFQPDQELEASLLEEVWSETSDKEPVPGE